MMDIKILKDISQNIANLILLLGQRCFKNIERERGEEAEGREGMKKI
jgi:hypothetical protein